MLSNSSDTTSNSLSINSNAGWIDNCFSLTYIFTAKGSAAHWRTNNVSYGSYWIQVILDNNSLPPSYRPHSPLMVCVQWRWWRLAYLNELLLQAPPSLFSLSLQKYISRKQHGIWQQIKHWLPMGNKEKWNKERKWGKGLEKKTLH